MSYGLSITISATFYSQERMRSTSLREVVKRDWDPWIGMDVKRVGAKRES